MRTETARSRTLRFALALAAAAGAGAGPAAVGAAAQQPPILVNGDTEVRSIRFTFFDHQTFSNDRLRDRMALRAPGALDFLPFVGAGSHPFSPLELQRDVARLRRFYARSGFPDARVDYAVRYDERANRVDIQIVIIESDPLLRGALIVLEPGGDTLESHLPDPLHEPWRTFLAGVTPREGDRVGELERVRLHDQIAEWLGDHGYPFARAGPGPEAEASAPAGPQDLVVVVATGSRARIGDIAVEGDLSVDERVIRRELPFESGDWYSAAQLTEGERELFGLDVVRIALANPVGPVRPDSLVDVRVRVTEHLPRVISGQVGYATETGLSAQADWAHRNFFGGAQTLSWSLQGRTGQLGIGPDIQRRYTASVSLKQPYFVDRRTSLVFTPHVEYRDDFRDRSILFGGETVVVRQWGGLRTASVNLALTRRRVFDFRPTGSESFDFRSLLVELDSLDHAVRLGTLGATLSWGALDNPIAPRAGDLLRASIELTGPPAVSSAQYVRLDASYARFVLLTPRSGLTLRGAAGRLLPFGRSVPSSDREKTLALLRLRDALFTAGGRYDVRGWGEQQLGPKFPDVRVEATEPDTVFSSERYIPLGGLARVAGSIELRLPLLGARPRHSTHVFVDAGHVWSPDDRFQVDDFGESALRWAVGGGIELGTPVGPFRVSVGYKLNPSPYDLRPPQAVLAALLAGTSPLAVPAESRRRWHLHLAIGQAF